MAIIQHDAPQRTTKKAFRTDIQALRAVAVGAVLLNHLWPNRMPGGYIGVDVFFVISGFLITTHLLSEIDNTNSIGLARFYVRRAKRLLPAAFTVIIVSLIAVALWIPPERWGKIVREAIGSLVYVENWVLTATSVDYSARSVDATPFQHYWSLSVEEQFYLLWPVMLIGLLWLATRTSVDYRRMFTLATVGLTVATFIFSLSITQTSPEVSYFHTLSRSWEFLIGGLVALWAPAVGHWFAQRRTLTLQGIVGWVGFALITWAAFRFTPDTVFPGPWALIPVAATALIILSGPALPTWTPFEVAKWGPIQYMGDISYSLYLWHWPIIVISPFAFSRDFGHPERLAILVASFILAGLTKKYIEDPGRIRLLPQAMPRKVLMVLVSVTVLVASVGFGMAKTGQVIQDRAIAASEALKNSPCLGAGALAPDADCADPFGPAVVAPQGEHNTPWFAPPECVTTPELDQILVKGKPSLVECDFNTDKAQAQADPETPLHVWIVGDSHAEHWKAAIYDIARGNGWKVTSSMHGGCPAVAAPLKMFDGNPVTEQVREACLTWANTVSKRIEQDAPDLIIASAYSSAEIVDDGTGRSQAEQLAEALGTTADHWLTNGAQLVVIRDVPRAGDTLGANCVLKFGDEPNGCVAPLDDVLSEDTFVSAAHILDRENVVGVDLSDYFCANDVCSGIIGDLPVFYDRDHISRSYSATLAPALRDALAEATRYIINGPVKL